MKIEGRTARFLIALLFPVLRVWLRTLRFEIDDRAGLTNGSSSQRYIGALWHNRLLVSAYVISRFLPNRRGAGLISASRDGALIADVVERFGFQVVRGSSSRRGSAALLQLADVLVSGRDSFITPDGPRGPVYQLGGGIIFLAQKTGVPIIPVNFEFSRCWRVRSWDRFIIPKPFSKIRVIFAKPHSVRPTFSDQEFELERARLQQAMMSLVEMR